MQTSATYAQAANERYPTRRIPVGTTLHTVRVRPARGPARRQAIADSQAA